MFFHFGVEIGEKPVLTAVKGGQSQRFNPTQNHRNCSRKWGTGAKSEVQTCELRSNSRVRGMNSGAKFMKYIPHQMKSFVSWKPKRRKDFLFSFNPMASRNKYGLKVRYEALRIGCTTLKNHCEYKEVRSCLIVLPNYTVGHARPPNGRRTGQHSISWVS